MYVHCTYVRTYAFYASKEVLVYAPTHNVVTHVLVLWLSWKQEWSGWRVQCALWCCQQRFSVATGPFAEEEWGGSVQTRDKLCISMCVCACTHTCMHAQVQTCKQMKCKLAQVLESRGSRPTKPPPQQGSNLHCQWCRFQTIRSREPEN